MKALLTGAFSYSKEQLSKIESLGYDITFVQEEREKLSIDVSDFDVAVCNGLFLYNDIKNFKKLKFIQATSAGLERLPLEYMQTNNISYCNAGATYAVPMAEWAIMSLLEILKNAPALYKNQQQKIWSKYRNALELSNKTVAIIGFGNVGKEIAKRLKPFGTKIIAVDKYESNSENIDLYKPICDLDKILPQCDAVILSLALNKETIHIIDEQQLLLMKNDCILINISRGAIINETALSDDIIKKFRGIALDVFEQEPLQQSSNLWNNEKVIITPHNSFISDVCSERLFDLIFNNLKNVWITKTPKPLDIES